MECIFSQFSIENSLNKLQHSHAIECHYVDLTIIMKINTHCKEKYLYILNLIKNDYKTAHTILLYFYMCIKKYSKVHIKMLIRFLPGWL